MISPSRYRAHRRTGRRRSLRLESLEERRLLAVLTVNTDLDVVDAVDGLTSLREAIVTANSRAGADEIVFDFGHDGPATIKLEQGELRLTEAVTITGGGPELLAIDAQQQSRIFNITAENDDFAIEGLTLTNGKTTGSDEGGGAIRSFTTSYPYYSSGSLTIHNSIVTHSRSTTYGGGVSAGRVIVSSSTISGNSAYDNGGGIRAFTATVNSSTISGNSAKEGGGIYAYSVEVNSSTISGNSAMASGGGIYAYTFVQVNSSTISGNWASYGGGIAADGFVLYPARTIVNNSIVAGNRDRGTDPDLSGYSPTIQYSLIGDKRGTGLTEAPVGSPDASGNLIGGPLGGAIDPGLGPLADNGGPTFTHGLLPSSPVIDAGDPLAVAGNDGFPLHDQRGASYANMVDGNDDGVARIDMGAHERQILTATILSVSSPTLTPVDAVTIQFTSAVSGFDLAHLTLSLNSGENLLTGDEILSSTDNQTFVLSGMAEATSLSGYYTLTLGAGPEIMDSGGGLLDSGESISWAMGRSTLGFTVDTLVDEADGFIDDGDVSLRDAIAAAAPGETIDFDASLDGGTILLTLGELSITRSLTVDATELASGLIIDAAGNDPTPAAGDGAGSRIFSIDDGNPFADSPVTIRGMMLTGGDIHSEGGAIHSHETLSIESTSISRNSANLAGGGIWTVGDVTINFSTISENSVLGRWGSSGGISAFGNVTVNSSTITENSAAHDSGGITGADVTVRSSTISGNSDPDIFASGELTIESQIAPVDFNEDNQLRCDDVDALVAAIVEGMNPPEFDLTANEIVDQADLDVWLTLAGLANLPSHEAYLPGDADLNGKVDASDLDVVGQNWLQDVNGWCSADFNTDGQVDARDLNLLALNWHQDVSGEVAAVSHARAPRAPLANATVLPDRHSSGRLAVTELRRTPRTADGALPERFSIVRHSLIGGDRGTTPPQLLLGSPPANGNLVGSPAGGIIDRHRAHDRFDHSTQSRSLWTELVDDLLGSGLEDWRRR